MKTLYKTNIKNVKVDLQLAPMVHANQKRYRKIRPMDIFVWSVIILDCLVSIIPFFFTPALIKFTVHIQPPIVIFVIAYTIWRDRIERHAGVIRKIYYDNTRSGKNTYKVPIAIVRFIEDDTVSELRFQIPTGMFEAGDYIEFYCNGKRSKARYAQGIALSKNKR